MAGGRAGEVGGFGVCQGELSVSNGWPAHHQGFAQYNCVVNDNTGGDENKPASRQSVRPRANEPSATNGDDSKPEAPQWPA